MAYTTERTHKRMVVTAAVVVVLGSTGLPPMISYAHSQLNVHAHVLAHASTAVPSLCSAQARRAGFSARVQHLGKPSHRLRLDIAAGR